MADRRTDIGFASGQNLGGIAGKMPNPIRFSPGGRMKSRDRDVVPFAGQSSTCPPTRIEGGRSGRIASKRSGDALASRCKRAVPRLCSRLPFCLSHRSKFSWVDDPGDSVRIGTVVTRPVRHPFRGPSCEGAIHSERRTSNGMRGSRHGSVHDTDPPRRPWGMFRASRRDMPRFPQSSSRSK